MTPTQAHGTIDVLTIFPDFFDALEVSLIGKARADGTLPIHVHDLRAWATDRHRTVDDTPAGGGPGMVMRADIWGEAIDDVLAQGPPAGTIPPATLIIPTPGGEPFTQQTAAELAQGLAQGGRMLIACGRYEGIDSRVAQHYSSQGSVRVREVSIGDYVLNGGEIAAMAMIEAVGRLVPGVVGNPDSLVEESHGAAGLLEYPVYTGPALWRGMPIPAVLRSGDHQRIADWRRREALRRTAEVRPDLLREQEVTIRRGRRGDAEQLHEVARRTFPLACPPDFPDGQAEMFVSENLSTENFRRWVKSRGAQLWVAEIAGLIVGYAVVLLRAPSPDRPSQHGATTADFNKFYLLPEHHGGGVARQLMNESLSAAHEAGMRTVWLGVNQRNTRAQSFYRKCGFASVAERTFDVAGTVQADFVMERTLDFAAGQ